MVSLLDFSVVKKYDFNGPVLEAIFQVSSSDILVITPFGVHYLSASSDSIEESVRQIDSSMVETSYYDHRSNHLYLCGSQ